MWCMPPPKSTAPGSRTQADPLHNFGIYEFGQLVGNVALVPVDPPRFGLGYWLAALRSG